MSEEKALTQAQAEALTMSVGDTGFTMSGLAEIFVQSGFFAKDVKSQSQAIVKILYGRELGLSPIKAMLGIYMVEGRPEVAAAILGGIIKKSGRYDYREKELTTTACAIEFYRTNPAADTNESIGIARFTWEDAQRAGLASKFNWKQYPEDMLWARALARGIRRYCPDAIGVPVYVQGEISDSIASNGIPARAIDKTTGEVLDAPTGSNEFLPQQKVPEPPASAPHGVATPETDPPRGNDAGSTPKRGRPRKADTPQEADRTDVSPAPPPQEDGASPGAPITFTINEQVFTTAGVTRDQMLKLFRLCPGLDRTKGKGAARKLLAELYPGMQTRSELTEVSGDAYIQALERELGIATEGKA
jgi:hypothetical protein